jgi:hypothetical protein
LRLGVEDTHTGHKQKTHDKEKTMTRKSMLIGLVLTASAGNVAFAAPVPQGQYPAPPAIAATSALPECGFAATESWGPNGFQYCDSRNIYSSRPVGGRRHP